MHSNRGNKPSAIGRVFRCLGICSAGLVASISAFRKLQCSRLPDKFNVPRYSFAEGLDSRPIANLYHRFPHISLALSSLSFKSSFIFGVPLDLQFQPVPSLSLRVSWLFTSCFTLVRSGGLSLAISLAYGDNTFFESTAP